MQVSALQQFNWYVVASDVSAGIFAYEFYVDISPTITVTGRTPMPSNALNLGQGLDNWQVGTGTCLSASGPASLVIYTGMLLVDEDFLKIGLEGATPSRQNGPAYLPCGEGGGIETFDSVTAAVLNADESSWGIVKSLYKD